jgi:dCMP deaminase
MNRRVLSHWDTRFLELAEHIASWSKDPSTKVGAVITDRRNRVISVGFNGFASGVKDTDERLNDRTLKYPLTIHAEKNAILFASRDLWDCRLYCTFMPCTPCADVIIQAGIKEVIAYGSTNDRWDESQKLAIEVLAESHVEIYRINNNGPKSSGSVGQGS